MKACLLFLGIYCMFPILTAAQDSWCVEMLGGGAYSIATPLTIHQSDFDDIEVTAQYATHSFQPPLYYSIRLARWKDTRAWEIELVHLKLELTNKPTDVQHFEISHGYNLIMVNRVWMPKSSIFRLGAGVVIAHPENTVRKKSLDEHQGILNAGYYLAGPTVQAAVGKRFSVTPHLFVTIEGKVTGSYASIPVADGDARVPNASIHGLLGLGYAF
jgi:hypothetical protein